MIILLIFAFLAGLVTVLSPCILPVLPILLAAGVGQGRYRPIGIIIGLILSFSFFTLTLTSLVQLLGISPNFLRYIAIILIAFFGLTMLSDKLSKYFSNLTSGIANLGNIIQEKSTFAGTGFLSGFILGIAIGLIWTPCAGPILATISTLVATNTVTYSTILITLAYSLGTGIPMFLIAYGGNKIINSTNIISGYTEIIRKIFGILMIFGALAIAFHFDVILQQIALKYFPMINIENNESVKKELEKLKPNKNQNHANSENIAPDFVGISDWINSQPLEIEKLRGKVVLVDFWTYSCINCVRTLPYIKEWYEKYKDQGFIIIGIHTPEFEFEKSLSNVQNAVNRFGIKYPVGLDNNYKTWINYDNHYWPAHYLIDQGGLIRYKHFGEGAYLETENAIRNLLDLTPLHEKEKEQINFKEITPEIYLGYERATNYALEITLTRDQTNNYDYKDKLSNDKIGLKGSWLVTSQSIQSKSDNSILDLNFIANKVYLVMKSAEPILVTVLIDNELVPKKYYTADMNKNGQIKVNEARMYNILDLKGDNGRHKLTLKIPQNVSLYAFTFGQEIK